MATTATATLKTQSDDPVRGWVLYDGECPLCSSAAARFTPLLHRHGFKFAPLQTPWVQTRLGLKPGEPLAEMKLLAADGKIFGGAEALVRIARAVWWAWPLYALAQVPGMKNLLRISYRCLAENRHYLSRFCRVKSKSLYRRNRAFFEMP